MKFQPVGARAVIRPIKPATVSEGGVALPETAAPDLLTGEVLAIPDGYYEDGEWQDSVAMIGETVVYTGGDGLEFLWAGEPALVIWQHHIVGIVEGYYGRPEDEDDEGPTAALTIEGDEADGYEIVAHLGGA